MSLIQWSASASHWQHCIELKWIVLWTTGRMNYNYLNIEMIINLLFIKIDRISLKLCKDGSLTLLVSSLLMSKHWLFKWKEFILHIKWVREKNARFWHFNKILTLLFSNWNCTKGYRRNRQLHIARKSWQFASAPRFMNSPRLCRLLMEVSLCRKIYLFKETRKNIVDHRKISQKQKI